MQTLATLAATWLTATGYDWSVISFFTGAYVGGVIATYGCLRFSQHDDESRGRTLADALLWPLLVSAHLWT